MIEYHHLQRPPENDADRAELMQVAALADRLRMHLEAESELIASLHIHNAQSKAIQDEVGRLLEKKLGFQSEVVVTADEGFVTKARADFFYRLSESSGIIAEVERGGTTANNHDLKDLWKAHLATNVRHLFLIVPRELFNAEGLVRERPFPRVVRRMSAFFVDERRYVDVMSVHVFGY